MNDITGIYTLKNSAFQITVMHVGNAITLEITDLTGNFQLANYEYI